METERETFIKENFADGPTHQSHISSLSLFLSFLSSGWWGEGANGGDEGHPGDAHAGGRRWR
jgi:hypothetical protein